MAIIQQRTANRSDSAAFRKLYSEFAPKVKAYLMRRGADPDSADDFARKTMVTAWQTLSVSHSTTRSAGADIFAIARNMRIARLDRVFTWQDRALNRRLPAHGASYNATAVSARIRHLIARQVLDDIPQAERKLLDLIYLDGMSMGQIARHEKLTLDELRARLRNVSSLMKTRYSEISASQNSR